MTNEETVAVPVELLKSMLNNPLTDISDDVSGALRSLLPKPKPRLVAVVPDNSIWSDEARWVGVKQDLAREPDLLTVIHSTIGGILGDDDATMLTHEIRAALGVTE